MEPRVEDIQDGMIVRKVRLVHSIEFRYFIAANRKAAIDRAENAFGVPRAELCAVTVQNERRGLFGLFSRPHIVRVSRMLDLRADDCAFRAAMDREYGPVRREPDLPANQLGVRGTAVRQRSDGRMELIVTGETSGDDLMTATHVHDREDACAGDAGPLLRCNGASGRSMGRRTCGCLGRCPAASRLSCAC